jgi:caffeoyl-CoA O-methyltransferase
MQLIDPEIERYCIEHSTKPSALCRELQEYTRAHVHGSQMLIGEMEASVLASLIRLGRVRRILELGTYTGYSALAMAEQLPADGRLITIDINPETTKLAQSFWERSAHGKKIEAIVKPGPEALASLSGEFDLVFIDADKFNYSHYLKWALEHLSPTGVIVVDNTLWSGRVLKSDGEKQTEAIIAHNELAASLEGFVKTLLPIRDGMFLIQRGWA